MTLVEADGRRFGDNIRSLRRRRGLSRAALARKADVGRDSLLGIESGKRAPRLDTLLAVADGLEVDPAVLLKGLRP
jgi:transcriptional regulator with XRE-family HTH domain